MHTPNQQIWGLLVKMQIRKYDKLSILAPSKIGLCLIDEGKSGNDLVEMWHGKINCRIKLNVKTKTEQ